MKNTNRILFTLCATLCTFGFCSLVFSNTSEIINSYNAKPSCVFNDLVFDLDFEMARINHCQQTGKNQFSLSIVPEHKPINKSPWYAFKLISEKQRNIEVFLHYNHHKHRYPPKISTDGENWSQLNDKQYKIILDGKAIKMKLTASKQPLYIAAQPIINNKDYINWLNKFKNVDQTTISELGKSKHNRSIKQLVSKSSSNDWILIVGRQHPPELTGAIALLSFVETIMESTELAKQFRNRYNLLVVPNLNPDGVAQGNWRYNMSNVDLNRDWGIYKQPEIALVGNELQRLFDNGNQTLIAGFDFHSTNKNVFYYLRNGLS